jgi:hypothetical protein
MQKLMLWAVINTNAATYLQLLVQLQVGHGCIQLCIIILQHHIKHLVKLISVKYMMYRLARHVNAITPVVQAVNQQSLPGQLQVPRGGLHLLESQVHIQGRC